jgi:hypothetical protein
MEQERRPELSPYEITISTLEHTLRVLRNDIAGRMNEVRPGSREYHGLEREDIELVSMYELVMGQVKEVHGKGKGDCP